MQNPASLLILILLAVTFIQSGYEKVSDWKGNLAWLKEHFQNTIIKDVVPASLMIVLILEIVAGIFCVAGAIQLLVNNDTTYGYNGAVLSCVVLILLLLGQRMAKDYDGARTIVIYFIPAVLAVYWLS